MIRFLILSIAVFCLYFAFTSIINFDSQLVFNFYDYHIETTIFTFVVAFLAIQLALYITLKFIFLFFNIPTLIRKRWRRKKLQQINSKLFSAISELIMGNKEKSLSISKKLLPDIKNNNDKGNITNLILAETEKSFTKKANYLRTLANKKNYSIYAAKSLASIFYDNGYYNDAEEYAVKAFNEDDTDTSIMLLLIRIYAKLEMWGKLIFIMSKLQRANSKLLTENAREFAKYYYQAAKNSLILEEDEEAIALLKSALELKPDYIEALNLFTELNTNIKNSSTLRDILESAFSVKPCFEIAEIYIKCSDKSKDDIYNSLAKLAKADKHNVLFLAIAAYLDLPEKIREMKECW